MSEYEKRVHGKKQAAYLVTGMTGHLGNVVVRYLQKRGENVVGLLLPGEKNPFPGVTAVCGDVTDKESLRSLFRAASERIVIHCAGRVSISSFDGLQLWNTNVNGTRNMVDLAMEYGVKKFIYVSSVHAIPEKPRGLPITETTDFSEAAVVGAYAKTKAAATGYVLAAAQKGLPACVVHPSGMIGPYATGQGAMPAVLRLYLKRRLPAGMKGGYDFVDVRDVARGILACCEKGRNGECYILSGYYYTVKEFLELAAKEVARKPPGCYLPLPLVTLLAGLWEKLLHQMGKKTVFTPYSVYTLGSNGNFSHAKASAELGYTVRPKEQTLHDMVRWTIARDAHPCP